MNKHIVSVSGGACSFWAAKRVIDQNGPGQVTLLFADVLMEDEDLYRFLKESCAYLGVPLTRISKGLSPWDLFAKEGMIGNSRAPICSVRLKRELLKDWVDTAEGTLYVGLDWTEGHRLNHIRQVYSPRPVEAPMSDPPIWDKCRMLDELRAIGITPPRLYQMGFPHNNCGGFCVKAGHAQFALLLEKLPERYAWHETQEEKLREQVGDYSVLNDRRGGGPRKTLTLRAFRKRIENGESFDRQDWGGCGCAMDLFNWNRESPWSPLPTESGTEARSFDSTKG